MRSRPKDEAGEVRRKPLRRRRVIRRTVPKDMEPHLNRAQRRALAKTLGSRPDRIRVSDA